MLGTYKAEDVFTHAELFENYPELKDYSFSHSSDIMLRDDSDGVGEYIAIWKYSKPIPEGLKLGK